MVVLYWLDLWEIFFLAKLGFEPGTSGSIVLHSTTVPSQLLFSPLTISGIYLWCRGIGGGIVLIGTVRDFLFGPSRVWTRDLWISSPALYHCAMATSGFHLWQFQVFNSGAEGTGGGIVSDWTFERFSFWPHWGLNLVTSGSLVLHSTTVPWQLLVFISDNFRYLPLVQRNWWWYCSDWTCERFSFWATPGFELGTSGSLVMHSTTVPWQLLVFTSDNFRYLPLVQKDWWWYWYDWTCERFSFWTTLGFELGTSGSLVLHSTTVPWQLLVFTSDNFRYLTLVQRDWWWYCSDWTCERLSLRPHWGLNWGPLDL